MRYSNEPFEAVRAYFRRRRLFGRLLLLAALGAALVGCWFAGSALASLGGQDGVTAEAEEPAEPVFLAPTAYDRQAEPDGTETAIDLSACGDEWLVTDGGSYRLTGQLKGRVRIRAEEQPVHLYLDGVDISSTGGPAILCESAGKLLITPVGGTENTVSDAADYRAFPSSEACIDCACDLTLSGTGSLSVFGFYRDAIRSADTVRLMDGSYAVKCKRTGIHGADGAAIYGGTVTISSEKNGVKTTKGGAEGRGDLLIAGGELNIIAGRYALVAERADLIISGGVVREKSIVAAYSVGGAVSIREGCLL